MKVFDIFSSFVAADMVEFNNQEMIDYIKPQTEFKNKVAITRDDEPFVELFDTMETKMNTISRLALHLNRQHRIKIDKAWVTKDYPDTATELHKHNGNILHGVYCLEAKEEDSSIQLISPYPWLDQVLIAPEGDEELSCKFDRYNSTSYNVPCATNMMMVFPAWLQHYTKRDLSTGSMAPRWTVSFTSVFERISDEELREADIAMGKTMPDANDDRYIDGIDSGEFK